MESKWHDIDETNESTMKSKSNWKKKLETNDSENTTIQNQWDAAKAILREKFIVIQASPPKKDKTPRKISVK